MIRVIIVDDQTLVREGIKSLLSLSDNVEVVGECRDGSEVVFKCQELEPDVILLDLSMPVQDGVSTLKQLRALSIAVPVLILTTFDDHQLILDSISHGAKGFLLKDVALETLVEAIETLHQGKSFILPAITESLLLNRETLKPQNSTLPPVDTLTNREIEVLRLIAGGYSNKEIARALHKSEGTIKNHVSNLLSKLGVRDRTRAVLLAIEYGIIN